MLNQYINMLPFSGEPDNVPSMSRSTNSPVETLAARLRALGAHRFESQRDLERMLGRSLTLLERRAFHMARDSRTNEAPIKRDHSRLYARVQATGDVKYPSSAKGKRAPRWQDGGRAIPVEQTHSERLPARGHDLRARYTDVPNPLGNANEQRLAAIIALKAKRNQTPSRDVAAERAFGGRMREAEAQTAKAARLVSAGRETRHVKDRNL